VVCLWRTFTPVGGAQVQGYVAHKKHPPPRNPQYDFTEGPTVDLGGVVVSYERCTPVQAAAGEYTHEATAQVASTNARPQSRSTQG
jgi:hypothetical protein